MSVENLEIELHDSVITGLDVDGAAIVVRVDAYVHHTRGVPGVDTGTGWFHRAEFRFESAALTQDCPTLPATISDGELRLGTRRLLNLVRVPVHFTGNTLLEVVLSSGETLTVTANEVRMELLDQGRYVEDVSAVSHSREPAPRAGGVDVARNSCTGQLRTET